MIISFKNLTVRNAINTDAPLLERWWNDGDIMAHAGFPHGTGQTAREIANSLEKDSDSLGRRLIIECDEMPIGEMSYRNIGDNTAEIGIKICDFSMQNKGLGRIILSMLIDELFSTGYSKIILDTNLNNTRAQHVYESLGFTKIKTAINSWKNQLGEPQSSIHYQLLPENFISYLFGGVVVR